MPQLKVAHRLALSFVVLALLVGGLAWLTLAMDSWQAGRIDALQSAALENNEHAAGMEAAAHRMQLALQAAVAGSVTGEASGEARSEAAAAPPQSVLAEAIATFDQHLARSRKLADTEGRATSERVGALASAFGQYRLLATRVAEGLGEGGAAAAEARSLFSSEARPHYEEALAPLLARHREAVQAALTERAAAADDARQWAGRFGLGAALLLLLIVVAAGVFAVRYVNRGLSRTVATAQSIAAGHLTGPIRSTSEDEFGDLTDALNEVVRQLSTATVSRTYVENIVHSMADPLVVVAPDVRVAMVNQALLDLLGYEAEEVIGASVTKIFAHTGRNRGNAIKQDIERALSGHIDSEFRTKSGGPITVSLSSALVRTGGEVQGLVIVAKDITEQKQREQELIEAKEEAERMVQLRDAFLANMSHEIRTPLTGILGSAQVLAEVVEGEHRKLAEIIEDAGNRLLDTINSVLEMARIEAGEVQPEMEVLDFAEEAEAVARVLRPLAEKKGLALRVYAPQGGQRVCAQLDRTCLNRILNNLIGNAIKFTKEGAVSIEIEGDGDDAVLTVRDTGIGINKEFIPHLFDDFKQESTGLRRSHEGSGLGLAITKKLVDMMEGEMAVESVKGLGSAFTARFERVPVEEAALPLPSASEGEEWGAGEPREAAASVPTFEPPPPAHERPARDLLLIEDNQQNAYMAKFMLEGYATDIANTPEEALDLARRFQYGVLLVDINLGTDATGIDLLHEFRKLEGYAQTPAVAVTAYALPGDRERFLGEGFDDYVSKPYRKEALRAAVEEAVAAAEPAEPVADLEAVLDGSFDDATQASPPAPAEPVESEAHVPHPTFSEPSPAPPAEVLPSFGEEDAPDTAIAEAEPEEYPRPADQPSPSDQPSPAEALAEGVPVAGARAVEESASAQASFPTVSPDEFLPPNFIPNPTSADRGGDEAPQVPSFDFPTSEAPNPFDDPDPFDFAPPPDGRDAHGPAGDGAGRPGDAAGG